MIPNKCVNEQQKLVGQCLVSSKIQINLSVYDYVKPLSILFPLFTGKWDTDTGKELRKYISKNGRS